MRAYVRHEVGVKIRRSASPHWGRKVELVKAYRWRSVVLAQPFLRFEQGLSLSGAFLAVFGRLCAAGLYG